MTCEERESSVPDAIRSDSLWRMRACRLALYLADTAWQGVTRLMGEPRTLGLADQLYRAVGSVSANLAEGYSRGAGRDRARFSEYALGSAREGRDRYVKGRHVLGGKIVQERVEMLTEIIRLLLTMIPDQRTQPIRDQGPSHVSTEE
jgi:four helix bundle protein